MTVAVPAFSSAYDRYLCGRDKPGLTLDQIDAVEFLDGSTGILAEAVSRGATFACAFSVHKSKPRYFACAFFHPHLPRTRVLCRGHRDHPYFTKVSWDRLPIPTRDSTEFVVSPTVTSSPPPRSWHSTERNHSTSRRRVRSRRACLAGYTIASHGSSSIASPQILITISRASSSRRV